ncbi:M16 family metallopeptidase [Litoreibacter arenae]|uniref:Peptidase, M16 family n=1 Tax=Litoreibacter arenae DSM 19593 TaxID=1123360 RepID=S9RV64_9RHOB|nr:pitrilysin family protein [Litoreibacter arenae]EPX77859.1 Peptidase, M16 family [Litoreibacter arenae DSM 19593]
MRRLIACLLAPAFIVFPALAAEKITTFTLDNGLEAVVLEDHRAPVVVHMLWYKAGAADEAPGVSGVAHFLEHLLFKATEEMEAGEFSAVVEANGGSDNAFTSYDYTAYHQRIAADRLELMMKMEADRMRNIQLTEEDIVTERKVILEERAQRTDSDPGALFSEQRNAAQYLNHPYGIPVIGWRHEMEQLSREDALAFYEKYYAPNAAVLIVAGDVDPDEVKALAETYYGPLEPTVDLPERERPAEPPQLAERRIIFEDPQVAQPYVIRSYTAPERDAGDQETAAALTILAELLGGSGRTSVLGRALQVDSNKAVYTSAFYSGVNYDDTTFGMFMVPAPGLSLQEAEDEMDAVVAQFMQDGIDGAHLERVKSQIRASLIYAQDDVASLGREYGAALTSGLTVQDVQDWPAILDAVTEDDIMNAARMVLGREKAVTGWFRKPLEQEVSQ